VKLWWADGLSRRREEEEDVAVRDGQVEYDISCFIFVAARRVALECYWGLD
jgi:hypothetical protein